MGGSETPGVQESPLQKTQAEVARQQWSDYQKRWVPAQQHFIGRTEGGLGNKQAFARGSANTNVQEQYGAAQQRLASTLAAHQVGIGSNREIFGMTGLSLDRGAAAGLARTGADAAVQKQYEAGLSDIVAMGRGQKGTSDQSLADLASIGGRQAASSAEIAGQNAAGNGALLGSALGPIGGYGLASAFDTSNKPANNNGGGNGMSMPTVG